MSLIQTPVSQSHRKKTVPRQWGRIGIFYCNEPSEDEFWNTMENLRDRICDLEGQFISLDLAKPHVVSLPETFYDALKNARWDRTLPFSLPSILQHNPHAASSFINRSICWQRLYDLLIVDDNPDRETVLVLENIDHASLTIQHEVSRLIRFHENYSLRRTFIVTLDRESCNQIIPELRNILEI